MTKVSSNKIVFNADSNISETFHSGGYYYILLSNNIIVLCLNGMYPFYLNTNEQDAKSKEMILWIEEMFKKFPKVKFIIQNHVFPGSTYHSHFE